MPHGFRGRVTWGGRVRFLALFRCTEVLDLEETKTSQATEIASLKRRVKKLEKKDRLRTHKMKRLYKVGLNAMVESSNDEASLDKRRGGNEGEGSRPQVKRRKTYVIHQDGSAALERISSSKPFQTVWPTGLTVRDSSGIVVRTAESYKNYLNAEKAPSPLPITLHGARVKDGESSYSRALYVSEWIIHQRCRVESPMWCQELMVHLAPPAAQEESNALTNKVSLDRAWFSLSQVASTQTDILERFKNLQENFMKLAKTHVECEETVKKLVTARALQVKELEAKLAKKDSALVYVERISAKRVAKKEKLVKHIEEDPITYNEAMQSWDAAFWKEEIDDEIGSIMENNTWVLFDIPPSCKPLGFRQKEGIDYFDTYAPVARITTIRLLLALAAIHNLVIHQMDVKTTFLNGDLDEEWHQKFDEVVLSNGFHLNQSNKCVYCKIDNSSKGVIIFLYVDDMLIFGTNQNKVDETKKFLSLRFSMKDMGEADVILGIKIKRENKGIVITHSYYIEKILKKFNHNDCSSVSTPMDPVEKLKPNTGKPVDQLEYSRAIGCLMYAIVSLEKLNKNVNGLHPTS
nr:hypothetical protein [Tanacetum cinerariifolium]